MRKWFRYAAIGTFLAAVVFAILYEASTHVVRGRLRGEAFYDGRPTSYWRQRCNDWLKRFHSADDAALSIPHEVFDGDPDGGPRSSAIRLISPPTSVWTRIKDAFRSETDLRRDWQPPAVLVGLGDSEHVLRELAAEDRFKRVAERSLWLNMKYREMEVR